MCLLARGGKFHDASNAEVTGVGGIPSFIRDLVLNNNAKDKSVNDIVLFKLNYFGSENVEKMYAEITSAVGDKNTILLPSIDITLLENRIRKASFVVIVTDLYSPVS